VPVRRARRELCPSAARAVPHAMIGPSGPPGGAEPKRKKSKSDREAELRALDKDLRGTSGAGVDYSKVSDRHVDDSRFERELAAPPPNSGGDRSAAFDAFMRLQTGQGERTIEDKINDKNRPTWEQYKKDNEDRLDIAGADAKKMLAYRKELDAERQAKLDAASKTHASLHTDSDSDSSSSSAKKKKKKEKKKRKKEKKKEKKKRKRKRDDSS
jgi:hypothetical protein